MKEEQKEEWCHTINSHVQVLLNEISTEECALQAKLKVKSVNMEKNLDRGRHVMVTGWEVFRSGVRQGFAGTVFESSSTFRCMSGSTTSVSDRFSLWDTCATSDSP